MRDSRRHRVTDLTCDGLHDAAAWIGDGSLHRSRAAQFLRAERRCAGHRQRKNQDADLTNTHTHNTSLRERQRGNTTRDATKGAPQGRAKDARMVELAA